jgi:uncharacterized coiled-coil DUF342 family protein
MAKTNSEADAHRRMIEGCNKRMEEASRIMTEMRSIMDRLRPEYQQINEVYFAKKNWERRRRTIESALRDVFPLQLEPGRKVKCWSVERLVSAYEN